MKSLFKKEIVDEREKMELYKAEHYAYHIMFIIAAIEVLYECYFLNLSLKEMGGELIILFAGSVTMVYNSVKHGNWNYRYKPTFKYYLICSLIASIIVSIVTTAGKMVQYESVRENIWGRVIPIWGISFFILFILMFSTFAITGEITKKKRKKLEEELDEDE